MTLRISVAVLLLLTPALAMPAPARADVASEAQLQYDLGVALLQQHRTAEALEHFLASNRLVPNANVAFNVAQLYASLRRPADAYNWYETNIGMAESEPDRARGVAARDRLVSQVAVLEVVTDPAGAELFVDRVELGSVGLSPRRVAVSAGAHRVIARAAGRHEVEVQATATLGTVTRVEAALTPLVGALRVRSTPPGASVFVAGRAEALGVTPLDTNLPIGELALVVRLEGHVEQSRVAQLRDGEVTEVEVALVRAASEVAVLSVQSEPDGASVRIDGREAGRTPLSLSALTPGSALLEISRDGLVPWSGAVALEAGGATRVRAQLFPTPTREWDSLRWAGYGTAAASVLVAGILGGAALSGREAFYANPTRGGLDSVGSLALASDVTLVTGLVLAGVTLLLDLLLPYPPHTTAEVAVDR